MKIFNKIKKIIITLLSFTIICPQAYAQTENNRKEATIYNVDTTEKYKLDIYWDDMQFTYVDKVKYIYDEKSHTYKEMHENYFKSETNNIKINNKTNYDMTASFVYQPSLENIIGTFSQNKVLVKNNSIANVKLNLSGKLDKKYNNYTTVGIISVTVS